MGLPRQAPGVQETVVTKPKLESPIAQKSESKLEEEKSVLAETKKSAPEVDGEKKSTELQKEEDESEKPQSQPQQKSFKQMFMSFLNE